MRKYVRRANAHMQRAEQYDAIGNAEKARAHFERAFEYEQGARRAARPAFGADEDACVICLGSEGTPIQGGCACRGSAGLAHVECRLREAESKDTMNRVATEWWRCSTCKAHFTGETKRYLSRRLTLRAAGRPEIRDVAMHQQISTELADGQYAAAEHNARTYLTRQRARHGDEGTVTLEAAGLLAQALEGQRAYEEAVDIRRAVLDAKSRALGEESGQTLNASGQLASTLSRLGKYTEAEALLRQAAAISARVFGAEDLHTLAQQHALAQNLVRQGKHDEAESLLRGVLPGTRRVLGPEHPSTLNLLYDLALNRETQRDYQEATALFRTVLSGRARTLGPGHPLTLMVRQKLATCEGVS